VPAYGIGLLQDVTLGPRMQAYLEALDDTLTPYGGRFLVHGGRNHVLEGEWEGQVILLEFPDFLRARQWYKSAEYQAIIAHRTAESRGVIMLCNGVSPGHVATDVLRVAAPG
jgi:uncharacterized protein (DUF1330 family)